MKMNSQKAVRELWHALFALAGLKTGKRRFWSWHEIPSVFFFSACGKWVAVACVRASVRVLKKERRARTSLCVCVCVRAPIFSFSPHQLQLSFKSRAPISISTRITWSKKQGFRECVHTSSVCCESRALDGSLSSLAKGGVTHRRRDERQHTAWFKYRRAWTNKTEPGEEEIEAGTDRERDERNVKTMDGCFAGCHVPARRENNLCFTSLVCFESRVCVCVFMH